MSGVFANPYALINDHIDHCLVHAEEGEGPQHAIDQFRAIPDTGERAA